MKRKLGELGAADLGRRIKGEPRQRTRGVPGQTGPVDGWLSSVHHCRIDGVCHTHALVKVQRSAAQAKAHEPEYREIGGSSDTEVEMSE